MQRSAVRPFAWSAARLVGAFAASVTAVQAQTPHRRPTIPGAPAGVTAFVNVTVVPMDRERVVPGQTVVIHDGWITALGPSKKIKIPAGATRIDGQGKYLIPGLADMHAHLWDAQGPDLLFLFVANGVTTIRNLDYSGAFDGQHLKLRAQAAAGELWSPRIYTSGRWGPYSEDRQTPGKVSTPTVADIVPLLERYRPAGYDLIKIHDELPGVADTLAAAAHQVGIPIAGHIVEGATLEHGLTLGYASIEHLTGYIESLLGMRVGDFPDTAVAPAFWAEMRRRLDLTKIPALAAATRRAGVWNCPTQLLRELSSSEFPTMHTAEWPERRYTDMVWADEPGKMGYDGGRFLDASRRMIKALQDSGAGLLLGTDLSTDYVVPGFSVHRELEALVHAGLTPYQALATGTYNVAAYFHTLQESGTVAVGKRADLVLLRGNPLADIRQVKESAGVMVGGRWLPRDAIDRRLAEIAAAVAAASAPARGPSP